MKSYISKQMQEFLEPRKSGGVEIEEAIDQPLYHRQAYAQAGQLSLTFFNSTSQDETVTNVTASELSKGRRFAIFGVSVMFIAGSAYVQNSADKVTVSALNDIKKALESASLLRLKILQKDYLVESPIARVPAGAGIWSGGAAYDQNLVAAADVTTQISYGVNGVPQVGCHRQLRVPIPLPSQTKFKVSLEWAALQTISTAGEIMVHLHGVELRALQ